MKRYTKIKEILLNNFSGECQIPRLLSSHYTGLQWFLTHTLFSCATLCCFCCEWSSSSRSSTLQRTSWKCASISCLVTSIDYIIMCKHIFIQQGRDCWSVVSPTKFLVSFVGETIFLYVCELTIGLSSTKIMNKNTLETPPFDPSFSNPCSNNYEFDKL